MEKAKNSVGAVAGLLVALGLCAGLVDSCNPQPEEAQPVGEPATQIVVEDPEEVAPFEPRDLPSIDDNEMHQLHFAAGNVCG